MIFPFLMWNNTSVFLSSAETFIQFIYYHKIKEKYFVI